MPSLAPISWIGFFLRGARDFDVCLEGHDLRLPPRGLVRFLAYNGCGRP
jgi:hypothetical protein